MTRIFDIPLYPYERHPDQDAIQIVRHPVVVVGAGPVGLVVAIDLAQQDVPVVVLDDNEKVSAGSRAVSYAKRPLEILDRLGCAGPVLDRGVAWSISKLFVGDQLIHEFDLLPEDGHAHPAFVNLQQYALEEALVARLRALQAEGRKIDLRGGNKVSAIASHEDHVTLEIDTPEASYNIEADWLVACDGAGSPIRRMMGIEFAGVDFEDHFLVVDVKAKTGFPAERRFWFDPPFNPGQSALLHKQPDDLWRIEFQIGHDIDREAELAPEAIDRRLRAMLGKEMTYELESASVYTFQSRRMEQFHKNRVVFAGDAAHQVPPFGARGANAGLQDADNLGWKLALVAKGQAPAALLDSYDVERIMGAEENMRHSTRATEFVTPKSEASRLFRDAVLDLAERHEFARPLVNSGRLSQPAIYDGSPINTPDALESAPARSRPGAPCPDAPIGDGFLLSRLGGGFVLLAIDTEAPETFEDGGIVATRLAVSARDDPSGALAARYLGDEPSAVYLIRPDQHVAARFADFDEDQIRFALRRATGKE
ncbi:FAD-dependent oxidoreductase [Maritimibacter fusiformis]|uniref:FAD-dependent oxidoreductase n=1 Tax=Maritimibacter fusiformis TaxID=2603819 RepID=A0A5D0RAE8_9RHOB|nr:FAD-dependent oxidoreductase [Maritimibacter fusiformis]TYB77855.1 FAD-dependent oxidoreductase [Maritimibacter fusiformis]